MSSTNLNRMLFSYFAGMLAILIGERLIGGDSSLRWSCDLVGAAGLIVAFLSAKPVGELRADQAQAVKIPRYYVMLGVVSVFSYALSTQQLIDMLSFDEDFARTWSVVTQCLAAILWISAALPLIALHQLFANGLPHVNDTRAKRLSIQWLGTAFAIASLIPINYIAHDTNLRKDLGYFKTAMPGESTQGIVSSLEQPIHAYLFFPPSSDVTEEVRTYFDQLNGPQFTKSYVDHSLEPELSKDLNVRDNGYVVFVRGEGEEKQVERIKIGADFKSAKRILKKLDEELREGLLKLAKDAETLYVTTGHGEMYWKLPKDADPARKISFLKKGLRSANFQVKELSLTNGLGSEIPEDARAVLILAPQSNFLDSEIESLVNYWKGGGDLFVALEPDGADLSPLLKELGVAYELGASLAHANYFEPIGRKPVPSDQRNLVTNKFSTHASITSLSRNNKIMKLTFSGAGALSALSETESEASAKVIIRSLEGTWQDLDGSLSRNGMEKTDEWPLAMASTFSPVAAAEDTESEKAEESRAVVFGDATWLNDLYIAKGYVVGGYTINPHGTTLSSTLFWLTESEELAGDVNNENDVKVQHTKEGQGWIFYGTVFLVPLSLFGIGTARIRRRTSKTSGGQ